MPDRADEANPEDERRSTPPPALPPPSPVRWVLLGVLVTLGVVVALRMTDASSPPASESGSTANAPTPRPSAEPASSARAEFASLYLSYLLKTYYVYERGFCTALLTAICEALLKTELLDSPSVCKEVPNDELVLAIGRFQHKTGLPVDGKAGPETVRMMLGGNFSSRQGMAAQYCPGWRPPGAASASASALAPALIEW